MRRRDTCILSEEGTQAAPFLLRVKSSWFFKGHKKKASKGKKIRVGFCVLPFSFKGSFKGYTLKRTREGGSAQDTTLKKKGKQYATYLQSVPYLACCIP